MLDVYVTGHREGVWVVRAGQRSGPLTEFGAVLEALGPPTANTEDLADMAYTLLQPDADGDRLPAADETPRTRARHRLARWSAALGSSTKLFRRRPSCPPSRGVVRRMPASLKGVRIMRDSLWLTFTEALVAGQVATARTAGVSLAAALARAGHPGLAHRVMTVLDTVDPPQPTGGPVVRGSPPPSWRWAPVLRLFLAGPQDTDAVRALTAVGYEIVPAVDAVDADAADALRVNLCRLVQQATGVALLPGWQHESEARLEAVVARRLGLAVHPVATWLACSPGR